MSSTAEPCELVTGTKEAGERTALRVGMRFDTIEDIPEWMPARAILLDDDQSPVTVFAAWVHHLGSETGHRPLPYPMTLLYIPAGYTGPVDNGPVVAAGGTESAGGQIVADAETPTMRGYIDRPSQRLHPFMGAGTDQCWCGLKEGVRVHATYEKRTAAARDRSMAAHPAGKGRPTSPDEAIFCMHNTNPFPGTTDHRCRECGDILPFEYIDGYNMGEK